MAVMEVMNCCMPGLASATGGAAATATGAAATAAAAPSADVEVAAAPSVEISFFTDCCAISCLICSSWTSKEEQIKPSSQSSVARRAALRSLEPPQSPAIAAAAAAGDARHTRSLRSPASAGSSTTNGSGTKRRRCNLEEPQVQQVPVVRVDADKSTPRRGRASAAAAAAASATATATAAVQCDNCERLRACLFEQTQDLEAVRRLVCAIVDRAAPNAEAPL